MRTAVPVLVAGVAAAATTLQQFLVPLLVQFEVGVSPSTATRYTLVARFASFLLVYGALLGVAYWVGSRSDGTTRPSVVAAVSFVVGASVALLTTAVVFLTLGPGSQNWLVRAVALLGQSAGTGVELGVVAFAGLVAGRR